ncbi:hypothetical protein [Clostridium weizhouense]|uniref:Uncharacterized protein n=1 Tax=Clostridium weizhouense TaxID=2859781 RepID=A0ABS7AKI8_9CLOT|nr:hypothetical protein [Clostridium weizhouense]MBW6409172.1 hypothetical protein [Clostridium weizhouense]
MIEIKKENLLKATPEYEDYSENVYNLSKEELRQFGFIKCSGCCCKDKENKKCNECKKNKGCKKKL